MGFLLRMMKFSARWVMKRVNWWARMRSRSSACLILMETRIELTEGSMRTFSDSEREMVKGVRMTSVDVLRREQRRPRGERGEG